MIIVKYFVWFLFYSCSGWIYESILCSITDKKLVNRGFLNGPVCPVYGVGAIVILVCIKDNSSSYLQLFITGAVLACTVEYITSVLLEKLFHAKWWDYSRYKFNIHGRICLLGAVVFGTFAVVLIKFINPLIVGYTELISNKLLIIIAVSGAIVIITDLVFTVIHLLSLNGRLNEIQEAINKHYKDNEGRKNSGVLSKLNSIEFKGSDDEEIDSIKQILNDIKVGIRSRFETSEYYTDNIKKLLSIKKLQDKRLVRAFPRLNSTKYNDAWEKVKERITQKDNRS